jgi:hypothetical protein
VTVAFVAGTPVAGTPVAAMTALAKSSWANVAKTKVDFKILFLM